MLALIAAYFSLRLYLYLTFPRPFREVWPGKWKELELPHEVFVVEWLVAYPDCRNNSCRRCFGLESDCWVYKPPHAG